jgi:6,7-dimethyl-8-ribityllumazine synthase
MSSRDIDSTSENVLHDWAREEGPGDGDSSVESAHDHDETEQVELTAKADETQAWGTASVATETEDAAEDVAEAEPVADPDNAAVEDEEAAALEDESALVVELSHEHAAGDLHIPDGYSVLEGVAEGGRRAVGVVVSRFNGSVTTQLLDGALAELSAAGVRQEAITIMVVPGAFELPLAATALAKTRRFACIVALGCVIRGDTPHFDYVSSEAASGLQLAALETGVPVSFGVLTLDRVEQAEARVGKGAEAVRSALEMADLFAHLRAAASR